MDKIKHFLLGLLIGMLVGIPLVMAAQGLTLVSGNGTELCTTANPMVVTIQ